MVEKKKIIKCLAYYDTLDNADNRTNNPAAYTKSTYVFDCLERLGYKVEILSASYTLGKKSIKGSTRKLSDNITLTTLDSMGRGCKVKNVLGRLLLYRSLYKAVDSFVREGDTLLVYHSLGYLDMVKYLKRRKAFKLLLEVEEIYGHVSGSKKTTKKEIDFFGCADGYIFSNYLLNETVNHEVKPYAVSHGAYKSFDYSEPTFDDNKIHIVYAGTFDPRKGGVFTAISAAEFLDENYHLHILGFGTDEHITAVSNRIADINKIGSCKVTYDGCLSGEEYFSFLHKCHIGLSTQVSQGAYNDSSFPSKVLVYMANGLRVVSVRIPAIETSDISDYIYYYNEDTAESVANAIKQIDVMSPYNGKEVINDLDVKFSNNLLCLLAQLNEEGEL